MKSNIDMLYEITHIRQSNRQQLKRWFTSQDMDLFVWFVDNAPTHFQLSYDKRKLERMVSWNHHKGFQHFLVDTGEYDPKHYKPSPLLITACQYQNIPRLARDFLAACDNIDVGLTEFIYARLMALPVTPQQHNVTHINHHISNYHDLG